MDDITIIWVFNGVKTYNSFPSAVFSSIDKAEVWISEHKLTGTLTGYPLDMGAYEWAIANDYLPPEEDEKNSHFIGTFSSAYQKHYHYEDGECP